MSINPFNLPNGVRLLSDGTLCLIRRNAAIEAEFDKKHIRIRGERRWYPVETDDTAGLYNIYNGQTAYIIGKGPSLDKLTKKDFEYPGPVLAINEAVQRIASLGLDQPIYGVQQDSLVGDRCKAPGAKLLVSFFAQQKYKGVEDVIVYRPHQFGLYRTSLTATVAVSFAKFFGCSSIVLYGFDACMDGDCAYAKSIGYNSKKYGDPGRFLSHRSIIEQMCKGTEFRFAKVATAASVSDKPQQLSERPAEPDELHHS